MNQGNLNPIINDHKQPIGEPLPDWVPPPPPSQETLLGHYCALKTLDPNRDAEVLYNGNLMDQEGKNWTYLPYGPFINLDSYRDWLGTSSQSKDPLFYTIIDKSKNKAIGVASYLRITPKSGSIEVGHIHFTETLKRTPIATEAMYLMMKHAFELGYRRYEWKCDALNTPSRAAAQRLGFSYEGTFRNATVYKGRSRDTAWYSITDAEWPNLSKVIAQWLAPENFSDDGQQITRLSEQTKSSL